jgi:ribosomal protein S11
MKTLYVIFILLLGVCSGMYAQAPGYLWAKGVSGNSAETSYSIATDAGGNVLVTGYFQSPTLTLGTTTLVNAGSRDIFIVKFDPNGNVLWATSAGGSLLEEGRGIATDASGNVVVTGFFESSSITFGNVMLANTGGRDVFVVKFDPNGNVLWAASAGGNLSDEGRDIATDASGNIVVTGHFYSISITFGTTVLVNSALIMLSPDVFVASYDPNGNVLWASSIKGNSFEGSAAIATDIGGNVLVTGYFTSVVLSLGNMVLVNTGNEDVFVVKYDPNGIVLWANNASGNLWDEGRDIATDASGNVLVTGFFESSSLTFGSNILYSTGLRDIFLVKYDAGGNVLWAKNEGTTDTEVGYSITTDVSDNILITGFFSSPQITFGTTTLTNAGWDDIFIVKLDPNGSILWATAAGGNLWDEGLSIATDASSHILVTGYFQSTAIAFGSYTLINAGNVDGFVVKLSEITSSEEINSGKPFRIYPNPSSGLFTIQSQENIHSIKIFNVVGESVYHAVGNMPSAVKIDISNQPPGIYLLRLRSETSSIIEKLVVSE